MDSGYVAWWSKAKTGARRPHPNDPQWSGKAPGRHDVASLASDDAVLNDVMSGDAAPGNAVETVMKGRG